MRCFQNTWFTFYHVLPLPGVSRGPTFPIPQFIPSLNIGVSIFIGWSKADSTFLPSPSEGQGTVDPSTFLEDSFTVLYLEPSLIDFGSQDCDSKLFERWTYLYTCIFYILSSFFLKFKVGLKKKSTPPSSSQQVHHDQVIVVTDRHALAAHEFWYFGWESLENSELRSQWTIHDSQVGDGISKGMWV